MPQPSEKSRVILVTGAAGGIGAAIAELAIARGHRVMLTDVDEGAVLALDIRSHADWSGAFDAARARFGTVDVLVNNAGVTHTGHARTLRPQQHRDIVEINLLGTITGVCTAIERMTAQGHGHIITVCSMTSFLPLPGYATYGGTKHALRAFHHSVAIEERDGPLDFTIVHPPTTRTGMLDQEMADPSAAIAFAEKSYAPEQIAEAVVDAVTAKPVEVVFPPFAGRFQRIVGVFPRLMRRVMPVVEAKGMRQRERLLSAQGTPSSGN
ncbi:SDR family NAD(P)-dependent oxidoreductase [Streptomyces sp. NPDC059627]